MLYNLYRKLGHQFFLGLSIGLCFAGLLHMQYYTAQIKRTSRDSDVMKMGVSYVGLPHEARKQSIELDDYTHKKKFELGEIRQEKFQDLSHHHDDDTIAKDLFNKVRVLCWVMTSPQNLEKKTVHIKNTWTRRCNKVLFMSSVHNDSFPTVGLDVKEGRSHLTAKTMQAFKYIYDHHLDDADWFMKADDDTYVILENLRYFLSDENTHEPVYFGQRFKPYIKQGYSSGGSGYVLSKEALKRFGKRGFHNRTICANDSGAEDVQMGKCLTNLGVTLRPSVDALNRSRFHCFTPESMIRGKFPKWYHRYDAEGAHGGLSSMSDYAISFHYLQPQTMYTLEFYVYHLQAYGIQHRPQELNALPTKT